MATLGAVADVDLFRTRDRCCETDPRALAAAFHCPIGLSVNHCLQVFLFFVFVFEKRQSLRLGAEVKNRDLWEEACNYPGIRSQPRISRDDDRGCGEPAPICGRCRSFTDFGRFEIRWQF